MIKGGEKSVKNEKYAKTIKNKLNILTVFTTLEAGLGNFSSCEFKARPTNFQTIQDRMWNHSSNMLIISEV